MRGGPAARLESVLETVVGRLGWGGRLREERALEEWPRVAGPELCRHAWAVRISHGVLFVQTSSPAWAREMAFFKPDLRSRLNQRLGGEVVRDIRFSSGGPRRPRGLGGAPGSPEAGAAPPGPRPGGRKAAPPPAADAAQALARSWEGLAAAGGRARSSQLQAGWKACGACGAPHPPELDLCPACRRDRAHEVRRRAEPLLSHCPWLDREGLVRELGVDLEEAEVAALKRELEQGWESALLSQAPVRAGQAPKDDWQARAMALAMLRTGRRPEEMDPGRCAEALGEPLAGWLLRCRG